MTNTFLDKIKVKAKEKKKSKERETSIRVLICHKNIWGSDNYVKALSDKNDISVNYWIEAIDTVQYGRAALDYVIVNKYDLIMVDGDIDSWPAEETIRKLREVDKDIKIVFSVNAYTQKTRKLEDLGLIDGVIMVPFQSVQLWQKIDELFSK